jgi:hypothetical protein
MKDAKSFNSAHSVAKELQVDRLSRLLDFVMDHMLEPGANWVINHPIISLLAVVALIFWSMRGYRIL